MDRSDQVPTLLTTSQVGELLGCSTRHLHRLVDSGRLPRPIRLGRLLRWDQRLIRRWIDSGCPTGNALRRLSGKAHQTPARAEGEHVDS